MLAFHPVPKSTQVIKRPETLKLKGVVANTLEHTHVGYSFLSRTQKIQHLRERINKWGCITPKSVCTKEESLDSETALRMGENICQPFIQ
jgi:hypothetical protein